MNNINLLNYKIPSFGAKPIPENQSNPIATKLDHAEKIDIFCHMNQDRDTNGSAVAFANELAKFGKIVRIITDGTLLNFWKDKQNENFEVINPANTELNPADLALVLDFNEYCRITQSSTNLINKYAPENIVGIDHHTPSASYESIQGSPIYTDTKSASTSELAYQFIRDKLNPNPNLESLESLYCGLMDDLIKSKYLESKTIDGKTQLIENKDNPIPADTKSVLEEIKGKLPEDSIRKVHKNLDILSNLTPEEERFRRGLYNRIKFTKDNNLAYVIIKPDDKEWIKLGQNNEITSKILNDFRIRVLNNEPNDKLIPEKVRKKLNDKNIKAIAVFYSGGNESNPANDRYYMSIHSKDGYAGHMTRFIEKFGLTHGLDFNAGGHNNRAGGNCPLHKKSAIGNKSPMSNWKIYINTALESTKSWKDPNNK